MDELLINWKLHDIVFGFVLIERKFVNEVRVVLRGVSTPSYLLSKLEAVPRGRNTSSYNFKTESGPPWDKHVGLYHVEIYNGPYAIDIHRFASSCVYRFSARIGDRDRSAARGDHTGARSRVDVQSTGEIDRCAGIVGQCGRIICAGVQSNRA